MSSARIPCPTCNRLVSRGSGRRSKLFARHLLRSGDSSSLCPGSDRLWIRWESQPFYATRIRSASRQLIIGITPGDGEHSVTAVETSLHLAAPESVFNDHQHKLVGFFPSLEEAKIAAEHYCQEWQQYSLVGTCECSDIATSSQPSPAIDFLEATAMLCNGEITMPENVIDGLDVEDGQHVYFVPAPRGYLLLGPQGYADYLREEGAK